jgi:cysteine desulfurase
LRIQPLLHGGGQEREVRSGTLDVPAIAGFVAALRETTANMAASSSSLSQLRNELIQGVLATIPDAHLQGAVQHETLRLPAVSQHGDKGRFAQDDDKRIVEQEDALPGLALFTFLGADPDALLFGLDQAGIAASIGAACTAGVAAPSHVLLASGVPEVEARSALRFSLGANTSLDEVQHLLQVLPGVVARARI